MALSDPTAGFDSIEEEGPLDGDIDSNGLFLCFHRFFGVPASPQNPKITMKSIVFDQFVMQAGAVAPGVATDMVSMNLHKHLWIWNHTYTFTISIFLFLLGTMEKNNYNGEEGEAN